MDERVAAGQHSQAVPSLRPLLRRSGVQEARTLPLTPALLARLARDQPPAARHRLSRPLCPARRAGGGAGRRAGAAHARGHRVRRQGTRDRRGERRQRRADRAITQGAPFGIVQVALPAQGMPDEVLTAAAAAGFGVVVHSVSDRRAASRRSRAAPRSIRRSVRGLVAAAGEGDFDRALGRLLIERAFSWKSRRGGAGLDVLGGRPDAEPCLRPLPRAARSRRCSTA